MELFRITNYSIAEDNKTVGFHYELVHGNETIALREEIIFPIDLELTAPMSKLLESLHIALAISYYKIFVAPTIDHPYKIDELEATFWNTVYRNGLAEFLYVNNLSAERLAIFSANSEPQTQNTANGSNDRKSTALLGIGGGKDSIVAGEILRQIGVDVQGFVLATKNNTGQTAEVAKTMNVPLLVVQRTIDPQILDLNRRDDSYNGHIPISVIFAFTGSILAEATRSKYVVVANEASSSIPYLTSVNGEVNHQWSKSFEFEQLFQNYLQHTISGSLWYFSAIRTLGSIAVCKIFATLPAYFEVFTSDNGIFKIDPAKRPNGRWSIDSPKSLSSYILLRPWLQDTDMTRIFGKNLLDESSLETLFNALVGYEGERPLDCVGTPDELVVSLGYSLTQQPDSKDYLIQLAHQEQIIDNKTNYSELIANHLKQSKEASLPPDIEQELINKYEELLNR